MKAERLLCVPSLHQSGVNAVSMSLMPSSTGVIVCFPMLALALCSQVLQWCSLASTHHYRQLMGGFLGAFIFLSLQCSCYCLLSQCT